MLTLLTACRPLVKSSLTLAGSTAFQPIVEMAADSYNQQHPEAAVNVQGGGSGTGISQVEEGAIDVGNSDVFASEQKGIESTRLQDHQVAVTGIAPIVNPEAGVKDVSHSQLVAIFTGKIRNWQSLGGRNLKIIVINRSIGSGTRKNFEKWGLDGQKSMVAQEQSSTGTVRKIVAATPGAISYIAFPYINDNIQPLSIDGVAPSSNNVRNNRWKIWSYEHMYTLKKTNKNTRSFLKYMMSDYVQRKVIPRLGYISVSSMKTGRSANEGLDKEPKR
ncbi:phosphate ABC superfamily ATP binding cassette transporter, substrate-binding lipoprotein [Liquorilactobacillus sucicola DSM 21376 = JCM 15457]|uniref:Phosphate-binding protein n=2 Tax=Liquorilactobacillus sucicola TaxID=519050 RepID=A0A0R2DPB7_9LACO|nr:phosphate ABC superfamily ATP binding cassette transporter, substrate-binding lipoprotein [Liquorilactobacillus sucicola DSM 21376 = JCM 15457]